MAGRYRVVVRCDSRLLSVGAYWFFVRSNDRPYLPSMPETN